MKKYERLYELLKKEIVAGAYRTGDKLPPKRTLAEEYAVSLATVETALDILRSEGYIDSKERSGCFVCYSQGAAFSPLPPVGRGNAAAAPPAPRETMPSAASGAAENGFIPPFPFYAYARAARAVLAENGERVLLKSPGGGVYELKTALKNYLVRSRGINVGEKQIVLGAGAEYLYGLLPPLLGREKIYGIESPSYGQIENVYAAQGVTLRLLPLEADGVSSEALRFTDANVLHVTPYRSFPSLVSATATKKAEYLRFAKDKEGYLIEDDYRSEFSPYAKPAETLFGADEKGYFGLCKGKSA
ncbi:MAG: GntR family transcriptional regulator, partial [Candidatus Scatosoma sp.]